MFTTPLSGGANAIERVRPQHIIAVAVVMVFRGILPLVLISIGLNAFLLLLVNSTNLVLIFGVGHPFARFAGCALFCLGLFLVLLILIPFLVYGYSVKGKSDAVAPLYIMLACGFMMVVSAVSLPTLPDTSLFWLP